MSLVVDSSVAACWLLPDEVSSVVDNTFAHAVRHGVVVPALFWFELRNVLVVNERRGRISEAVSNSGLKHLDAIPTIIDRDVNELLLLQLARHHGLTVYDTAYLECARRLGLPLATLDKRLAAAAAQEAVELVS